MTEIKVIKDLEILSKKEKFLPSHPFDSYGCAYCIWRHRNECFHYNTETKLTDTQRDGICEHIRWYILKLTPDYTMQVTPYQWRLDVLSALAHRHIINVKMELDNANIKLSGFEEENHFEGINYWKGKVNRLSRELENYMKRGVQADIGRTIQDTKGGQESEDKPTLKAYTEAMKLARAVIANKAKEGETVGK